MTGLVRAGGRRTGVLAASVAVLLAGGGIVAGGAATAAPGRQAALATEFLSRFQGAWKGSGFVVHPIAGRQNVRCDFHGTSSGNSVSIDGTCRAMLLFSRHLSADLTFSPATGRYSGIYRGAKVGPARLDGLRQGDSLRLTVTWPKPVNGDTTAEMIISNAGKGDFRLEMLDSVRPGTATQMTTDVSFRRP